MASPSSVSIVSVHPLFIRDRDIGNDSIEPMVLCRAITSIISPSKLQGVQIINNIWRIYIKDKPSRLELFIKESIIINGRRVKLYDQNPNRIYEKGDVTQQPLDKLTIRNLPLSVANEEIAKLLQEKNVVLKSSIKYGYLRYETGQLSSFMSGDRYVYVLPFDNPLPRKQIIANCQCLIFHHGKHTLCVACGKPGHKVGDESCPAKPKSSIMSFRGYQHPLSNHYACHLQFSGKEFRSVEHAFFWHMATDLLKPDLAHQILNAKHAGIAKRLSHEIADEQTRWEWEENNIDLMKDLLVAKAHQCQEFRICLVENCGKVFVEATPSKLWGSGLSPYVTEHASPEFWPGRNMLGALLHEVANECSKDLSSVQVAAVTPTSMTLNTHSDLDNENMIDMKDESDSINANDINDQNDMNVMNGEETDAIPNNPASTISRPSRKDNLLSDNKKQGRKKSDKIKDVGIVPKRTRPNERNRHKQRGARSLSLTHASDTSVDRVVKQIGIKEALSGASIKRKTLASSPDQKLDNQGKLHKADCDVP